VVLDVRSGSIVRGRGLYEFRSQNASKVSQSRGIQSGLLGGQAKPSLLWPPFSRGPGVGEIPHGGRENLIQGVALPPVHLPSELKAVAQAAGDSHSDLLGRVHLESIALFISSMMPQWKPPVLQIF
jgi:hypothetical protein